MSGLLIVNADDWGSEEPKTEAIRAAFAAGAISSASAMVYMEDSDRAAEIARREELPLGLHLNLTQAFSDPGTPPAVRARQQGLLEHFADWARRRRTLDPRRHDEVRAALADQLARFRELHGRDPDHLDGHNHVHLCLDVLAVLPHGLRVRPAISPPPAVRRRPRPAHALRDALLRARLRAPDHAFDFEAFADDPGGDPCTRALGLSERAAVEVMCHPDQPAERAALLSPAWREALAGRPLGTYADLGRSP